MPLRWTSNLQFAAHASGVNAGVTMQYILKIIALIWVLGGCSSPGTAEPGPTAGDEKLEGSIEREELPQNVGYIYDRYATQLGAYYLNELCDFLGDEERKRYEWHGAMFTEIVRSFKNDSMIAMIHQGAQATVSQPEYASCGKKSQEIATAGAAISEDMVNRLSKLRYDPKTSYNNYVYLNFVAARQYIYVAEQCGYLEGRLKSEVRIVREKVAKEILLRQLTTSERKNVSFPKFPAEYKCDSESQAQYVQALRGLRRIEKSLFQV